MKKMVNGIYVDLTQDELVDYESRLSQHIAEMPARALNLLREQRNQLLAQSDWMAVSDRTMTQAQIDYRQALRDLPATTDPQLDDQGNLTNVTWPTEPGA